jgi:hypothetical protein
MKQKIFISYAHQDRKYAEKVRKVLAGRGVIDDDAVALDFHKEINVGSDARKAIRESIGAASKVVLIATDNAVNSQWVNYEIGMAEALDKDIIVVSSRRKGKSSMVRHIRQRLGQIKVHEIEPED